MTGIDALRNAVATAASAAQHEGTVGRVKAQTAAAVMDRIVDGELGLTDAECWTVADRMNRAAGTADRTVAVSMLEVIIGVGIRHAA